MLPFRQPNRLLRTAKNEPLFSPFPKRQGKMVSVHFFARMQVKHGPRNKMKNELTSFYSKIADNEPMQGSKRGERKLMEPKPFLKKRFRVKLADYSDGDHWSGGEAYHRDARCPACKIPLLLLWDINCKDSRFPPGKFGPLERLPLYFCWGCVNELSYQIVEHDRIHIHPGNRWDGPSFSYEPYPEYFERRGLLLFEGVPDKIQRMYRELIIRWDTADGDAGIPEPAPEEQKELTEFFGHPVILPMCFFHHQLGGKPLQRHWAEEVFQCPNPACTGTISDRLRGRKRALKFLAGVLNDPWAGLPMIEQANEETKAHWNYFISVQYHICDRCWTVLGCNRCD